MDFSGRDYAMSVAVGCAVKCCKEKPRDRAISRYPFVSSSGCNEITRRFFDQLRNDIRREDGWRIVTGASRENCSCKTTVEQEKHMLGDHIGGSVSYFRHQ